MGVNIHLGGANAAAVHPGNLQPGAYPQRLDGLLQQLSGHTRVQQRAQKHVAADAGEAVKVGNAHSYLAKIRRITEAFIIGKGSVAVKPWPRLGFAIITFFSTIYGLIIACTANSNDALPSTCEPFCAATTTWIFPAW